MVEDLIFKNFIARDEININSIKLLTKDEASFNKNNSIHSLLLKILNQ